MYRNWLMSSGKGSAEKKQSRFRLIIQVLAAAVVNGYAAGFFKGQVFDGPSKAVCVPVFNCYSCPGALGACPIGSLQAVLGSARYNFSFYVIGMMMLFGMALGRLICGFLCPFGLVQDLLHKIPVKKVKMPEKLDRSLRYLKYVILIVFVVILPMVATNKFGLAPQFFCEWLCPAGTLGGGIPLLATNESLRRLAGLLFGWKFLTLVGILVFSAISSRPFCRYFCPLGAFYAILNRVSFYRMNLDKNTCVGCKQCEELCPMAVELTKDINNPECIRCGKCKAVCPTGSITSGFAKGDSDAIPR